MSKKKLFALILSVVVALSVPVAVFAHPGRTDEYGGHYDWKTGEYHYHHGYPAHQHIDGYCPYDYDDQTDHSNHGGGYSYDYDYDYDYGYSYTDTDGSNKLTLSENLINEHTHEAVQERNAKPNYTVIGHILNVVGSLLYAVLMGCWIWAIIYIIRGAIFENKNIDLEFGVWAKFLLCCDFLIVCSPFFISAIRDFYRLDIDIGELFGKCFTAWLIFQFILVINATIGRVLFKKLSEIIADKRLKKYLRKKERERQKAAAEQIKTEQVPTETDNISEKEEQRENYVEENSQTKGYIYNNTREFYESLTSRPLNPAKVYWTDNGRAYHSTINCPTLANSVNIRSGNIFRASHKGNRFPCTKCIIIKDLYDFPDKYEV